MKTIGLIGGMSWESTITYYSIINEYVKKTLGGLHSAKIILYSVEFDEIEKCQSTGNWEKSADILGDAACKLEKAGADMVLICTNTMHKVYSQIQSHVSVPVIHIADATADALQKDRVSKVALLGTRYTMREDFYKSRLIDRGFEVLIPENEDIDIVNRIIFDELCVGEIKDDSRREFIRIIENFASKGAKAVILGCTEIGLLVGEKDSPIAIYDTTIIHATKAAQMALDGDEVTLS